MKNAFVQRMIPPSPDCPLLAISSQLMSNFREAEVISSVGEVRAVQTVTGDVALFSRSDTGDVFYVFPDPTQTSGWNAQATNLSTTNGIQGVTGPDGAPAVLTTNGTSTVSRAYLQNNGATTQWVTDELSIPGVDSSQVVAAVTAAAPIPGSDGSWYVTTLFSGGEATSTQYLSGTSPLGNNFGLGGVTTGTSAISAAWAGGSLINVWIYPESEVDFFVFQPATDPTNSVVFAGPGSGVTMFSTAPSTSGSIPFTAALFDGAAYVYDAAQNTWAQIPNPPSGSGTLDLVDVQILSRGEQDLHLLAVGSDNRLYHSVGADGPGGDWTTFSPLVSDVITFSAALDGQSDLQVFVLGPKRQTDGGAVKATGTGQSLRLVSIRGAQQDVSIDEIALTGDKPLLEVMTYSTEITALDEKGNPQPNKKVWVWASEPAVVNINGVTQVIDQDMRAEVKSNLVGKVVMNVDTRALSTAVLKVRTELMAEDDASEIVPNTAIKEMFATITADQLKDAKDQLTGKEVFPKDTEFEPLAGAVSTLGQLSQQAAPGGRPSPKARPRRCPRAWMSRADREFHTAVDRSSPANEPWLIDFLPTANVRFEKLTPERLRAVERQESIFSRLKARWSEFWGWAREGTVSILRAFYDGAKAVVKFVANGITLVFEAEIKLVEQVFDVVEAVFRKVKATIEKVFSWLAVLFNWDDILRVQGAIEHGIDTMLDLTEKGVPALGGAVNGFLTNLKDKVQAALTAVGSQTANENLGSLQATAPDTVTMGDVMDHNVAANNLVNMPPGPDNTSIAASDLQLEPIGSAWTAFVSGIESAFESKDAKDALQKLRDSLGAIASRPNELAEQGVSVFLDLIQLAITVVFGAVEGAVSGLVQLVQSGIVELFRAMLDAEIQIPILTALYKRVTKGSKLSFKSVTALVVSMVATPVYKLISAATTSPFTQEFVDGFKQGFTADWILSTMGVNPAPAEHRGIPAEWGKVGSIIVAISSTFSGLIAFFTDLLVGALESEGEALEFAVDVMSPIKKGVAVVVALSGTITMVFSTPLLRDPSFTNQLLANALWICEGLFLHVGDWAAIVWSLYVDKAERAKVLRGIDGPGVETYLTLLGIGLWVGNFILIARGCNKSPPINTLVAIQRGLGPMPLVFVWTRRFITAQPALTVVILFAVDVIVPLEAGLLGAFAAFQTSDDPPPRLSPPTPLVPALSA